MTIAVFCITVKLWQLGIQLYISYLSCCCPLFALLIQNNGQQRLGWATSLLKRDILHEWTISLDGQLWHGIENCPFWWWVVPFHGVFLGCYKKLLLSFSTITRSSPPAILRENIVFGPSQLVKVFTALFGRSNIRLWVVVVGGLILILGFKPGSGSTGYVAGESLPWIIL